jgi:hypothetical protein
MSVQIVFSNGASIDTLDIDATLSIGESLSAQATEHPVETGGVISDHVIAKPKTLRLEGIISATPVEKYGLGSFQNALLTLEGAAENSSPDPFRAHDAQQILRAIHAAKLPIVVGTGLGDPVTLPSDLHNDMVIETLEFPRDDKTGDAVRFTATLKEIQTVKSATVAPWKGNKAIQKSRGKQATKVVDPRTLPPVPDSLFKSMLNPSTRTAVPGSVH